MTTQPGPARRAPAEVDGLAIPDDIWDAVMGFVVDSQAVAMYGPDAQPNRSLPELRLDWQKRSRRHLRQLLAYRLATPPPVRRAQEEVDVKRLATAAYRGFHHGGECADDWDTEPEAGKFLWYREMRAVLADLSAQGFVVVGREDLATVLGIRELVGPMDRHERDAINRLRQDLAAAPDEPGPIEFPDVPDPCLHIDTIWQGDLLICRTCKEVVN